MSWRNSREYRIWRIKVIRRDKRCIICNSIKHREAHHLYCASYYPEYRFDIDKAVTLCRHCHSLYHNKFVGSYRKKCNKESFDRFMKIVNYLKDLYEKDN
jgi:hypothetical protein